MNSERLLLGIGTSVVLRFIDLISGNFVGDCRIVLTSPIIVEQKYTHESNDWTGYTFSVFSIPRQMILEMLDSRDGDERVFLYAENEKWKALP